MMKKTLSLNIDIIFYDNHNFLLLITKISDIFGFDSIFQNIQIVIKYFQ